MYKALCVTWTAFEQFRVPTLTARRFPLYPHDLAAPLNLEESSCE